MKIKYYFCCKIEDFYLDLLPYPKLVAGNEILSSKLYNMNQTKTLIFCLCYNNIQSTVMLVALRVYIHTAVL